MTAPDPTFDPYKTLQVDPEAEDEVIEAAYRRLARKYHPDVAPGADAQARMIALNRAWEMIGDPIRRASWDRVRAAAAVRGRPATPAPQPPSASRTPAWRARHVDPAPPPPPGPGRGSPARGDGSRGSPPGKSSTGHTDGGATEHARDDGAWGDQSPNTGFDAFADAAGRAGGRPGPERVSRDWSAGRSFAGAGYDESMRAAEGHGAAGPPPGRPSGSVLAFGRYAGWSLGEIARADLEYLEWLERMPIGRAYQDEIDALLRKAGRRRGVDPGEQDRRGLFRR